MAKAFKNNKSTVDVYTTDEVYTKDESDIFYNYNFEKKLSAGGLTEALFIGKYLF